MEPFVLSTAATALGNIVVSAIKSFLPETPDDKLRSIELAIKQQVVSQELLKGQIEVNVAEAANPNRKWATWRELIGYTIWAAIAYQWLALPVISMLAQASGHPLDTSKLITVDIVDVLYVMCGMLGLDAGPLLVNKLRDRLKK